MNRRTIMAGIVLALAIGGGCSRGERPPALPILPAVEWSSVDCKIQDKWGEWKRIERGEDCEWAIQFFKQTFATPKSDAKPFTSFPYDALPSKWLRFYSQDGKVIGFLKSYVYNHVIVGAGDSAMELTDEEIAREFDEETEKILRRIPEGI